MRNENQEHVEENLIKKLKSTKEYKAWQESLFAIIGCISNEEIDDEKLMRELMADHLYASFALHEGLEKSKYYTSKEEQEQWLLDNSGQ